MIESIRHFNNTLGIKDTQGKILYVPISYIWEKGTPVMSRDIWCLRFMKMFLKVKFSLKPELL